MMPPVQPSTSYPSGFFPPSSSGLSSVSSGLYSNNPFGVVNSLPDSFYIDSPPTNPLAPLIQASEKTVVNTVKQSVSGIQYGAIGGLITGVMALIYTQIWRPAKIPLGILGVFTAAGAAVGAGMNFFKAGWKGTKDIAHAAEKVIVEKREAAQYK